MPAGPLPPFLDLPRSSVGPADPLAATVRELAREAGFPLVAITTADPFPGITELLGGRIDAGHYAGMQWFDRERARVAADPRNLQRTARSIVSVGIPYWPGPTDPPDDGVRRGRIARYAWGLDYHALFRTRLDRLAAAISAETGAAVDHRSLTDTAQITDRAVGARAGLGWYGKNTCLLSPGYGSWFMVGELLVDLDLAPDRPLDHGCGRCTTCIERCPTGALVAPYTLDANRCLSFQTIEQRGAIPPAIRPLLGDWVFGCDVCQETCPYTGAVTAAADPAFAPRSVDNAWPSLHWLLGMDGPAFRERFRGTSVVRAKRRGLARNAAVALGNTGDERDLPVLARALREHDEALPRGHAAWALARIDLAAAQPALEAALRVERDGWVAAEIRVALDGAVPGR